MKSVKKTLAVLLTLIMIMSTCPVLPRAALSSEKEDAAVASELPKLPDGFSFSGMTFTDENDNVYYYIVTKASEYGLINGYWIDADGKEVINPDDSIVFADDATAEETNNLPSSYDSRDHGLITDVEYQIGGTCWAHATMACLETSLIKQGYADTTVNLSEYHTVRYGLDGYFNGITDSANDGYIYSGTDGILDNGGNTTYSSWALSNFAGAANESDYSISDSTSSNTDTVYAEMAEQFTYDEKYNHDIVLDKITTINFTEDNVKKALLENGAVYMSYNSDINYYTDYYHYSNYNNGEPEYLTTYYCPESLSTNHAVTIVGWDDNFSKSHFLNTPSRDGAWLVKNSWAKRWGNDGYFWLSYEDATIYKYAYTLKAANPSDFQNVYLYDGAGYGRTISSKATANVFTAKSSEYLTKISTFDTSNFNYTLKIYKNLPADYSNPTDGTLAYTQTGKTNGEKYIDVMGDVELAAGEIFSVVLEGSSRSYLEGVSSEEKGLTSNLKESYYMDSTGAWIDSSAAGYNNACIRAFTNNYTAAPLYRVKFVDPPYYSETKTTTGGNVELPSTDGHTWVFKYNDANFNGTGVDKDMTVEAHCYKTSGEISSDSVCVTQFKCIYCGKQMLPDNTEHNFTLSVIPATESSVGYTSHVCSKCGYTYEDAYTLYDGAVGGTFGDNLHWQFVNNTLSIFGNGVIPAYSTSSPAPWSEYAQQVQNLVVNEGITNIGSYSFYGFTNMTELSLPSTLEKIGDYAFYRAQSITELILPENLKTIGTYAFSNSASLKKIVFNDVLTSFGSYSFENCDLLEEAIIPGSIKTLYNTVYYNCDNVKRLVIEEGVKSIVNSALFFGFISPGLDDYMLDEIVLPSSLESLSYRFFQGAHAKTITIPESNPNFCVVDNVVYSKDMTTLYYYCAGKPEVYYKIPDSVSTISSRAFNNARSLLYLDMSSCAATTLATGTIYGNYDLKNVMLPSGLTNISSTAFDYNPDLSSIFISATVESVKDNAFSRGIPKFYTDSESSAIKAYADTNSLECVVLHSAHDYNTRAYSIDSTHDVPGMTIDTCECGQFKYAEVPAGCIYTAQTVSDEARKSLANCTDPAVYYYSCSVCGKVEKDDSHTFTSGTALGHSYKWIIDQDASCTETGIKHQKCSVCNETASLNTVIATKPHTDDNNNGYCDVCNKNICEHAQVTLTNAKAATCTQDGYTGDKICDKCGITTEIGKTTTKLGHKWNGGTVTTAPKCEEDGVRTYTCQNDTSHTYTEPIAATGHTVVDDPEVKATCTESGLTAGSHCSVCKKTIVAQTIIPAKNHSYSEVVTKPTCLEKGFTTYTCSACGDKYVGNEVAATGHHDRDDNGYCDDCSTNICEHAATNTVGKKDATCTAEGYTGDKICSKCGIVMQKGSTIKIVPHEMGEWKQTKKPTCSQDGTEVSTCANCDYSQTRTIPAIDHHDDDNNGYCDDCNKNICEHPSTNLFGNKEATCTAEGYTGDKICSKCGATVQKGSTIAKLPHEMGKWMLTKEPTCAQEGTEISTCVNCDYSQTRAVPVKAHHDNDNNGYCDDCSINICEHPSTNLFGNKEATCTEYGYTGDKVCSKCGATVQKGATLAKLPHTMGEWMKTKDPTCTEDGLEVIACANCGYSQTRAIPATGHVDDDHDEICNICGETIDVTANCSCICHKTGFSGFIYKIVRFFWKLFKIKQDCACGVKHY